VRKIAVSTTTFGEFDLTPIELCAEKGFEVILNPYRRTMKAEEVVELAKSAMGLVAGTEPLTADVISRLTLLKVISRCGAGLENVDLVAAKKLGIKVFNTPDAPTRAVAELTVGLILTLLRKISQMDRAVRAGRWDKVMGNLLHEKKVGIVGFGKIGRKVAEMLAPFGCEIVYADPSVDDGVQGSRRLNLDRLLAEADIVSIHAATKEKILGAKELGLMKPGALLVNVARGEAVDEQCLCDCLSTGRLSGAALDVFPQEPYAGPLTKLNNVILTPHVGSYAREARVEMEKRAVENLFLGLEAGQ